jgi:hypothetical protein
MTKRIEATIAREVSEFVQERQLKDYERSLRRTVAERHPNLTEQQRLEYNQRILDLVQNPWGIKPELEKMVLSNSICSALGAVFNMWKFAESIAYRHDDFPLGRFPARPSRAAAIRLW